MKDEFLEVKIKGVIPTPSGCALFLGSEKKIFIIYIDPAIGNTIELILKGITRDRPITHDLMAFMFLGFDIRLEHMFIHSAESNIFFAHIVLKMQNELGTKMLEMDARPSDAIALALLTDQPILVKRVIYDAVEDMTEVFYKLQKDSY